MRELEKSMASERKTPEIVSPAERASVSLLTTIQERIQDLERASVKLRELDKLIENNDSESLKIFFSSLNPFLNVPFLKGRLEALNKEIQHYQHQKLDVKAHSLEQAFSLSRILKALDVVAPRMPTDIMINREIESDFASLKQHQQSLQAQRQYLEKLMELRDAYSKTLREAEAVSEKLNETPFKGMLSIPSAKLEVKRSEPIPAKAKPQKSLEQSPQARTREARALGIKDKPKEKKITGEQHRKAQAKEYVHKNYEINPGNRVALLNLGYKDSDLISYDKKMLQKIRLVLESDIKREADKAELHRTQADKLENQKMQTVLTVESETNIIKPEWILKERVQEEIANFKITKYQEEMAKIDKLLAKKETEKVDIQSPSPPELTRRKSPM